MSIIKAEHINKVYETEEVKTEVIHDLSMQIEEGEFLTITGASGSGKSTLLYLLSGMEPLTKGKVLFMSKDLSNLSDKELSLERRTSMAFVFQFFNLLSEMTVQDNVLLPSLIKNGKIDEEWLMKVLDMVGLKEYSKKYPYELSGGQQQRVAIARALYMKPKIIFADEPTGNLDSVNSEKIMDLFVKINKKFKTTIVMVTHSDKFAEYGTRKIVIKDGAICK